MPCERCSATKPNGSRCKNRTCKMYPYCWIHLKSINKLQVKDSTIPNAGKGLFYVGKDTFPSKKLITHYSAKQVSSQPNKNSNYDLQISRNKFLDSSDPSNYVGRYINDKRNTNRQANVRFTSGRRIYDKMNRKVIPVISKSAIHPNTELLINYGRSYW